MTEAQNKRPLLIVGSLAFDSVETPRGKVDMALGGSASYASIAASYFASPQVVGVVGEDFADHHMAKFRDHSVDTRGIEKAPGKTFHWKGRYHENFNDRDTLETALNVFEAFDPELPEDYRSSRTLFLANIHPALQLKVLEQARGAEIVALDTMNLWIETEREALVEVLKRVDFLFINDEEARMLSGEWNMLSAAERIRAMGPEYLVIKRGEYGALLFGPDTTLFVPAILLSEVVDPTGAGDSFAGGFLGFISAHEKIDRQVLSGALMSATVLASFSVEAFSVDGICNLSAEQLARRRERLDIMIRA